MARKKKPVEPKLIKTASINPDKGVSSAPDVLFDPADPGHRWERPLQAPGRMQVDFEERVNFQRLHEYRLARTRNALKKSKLGALLVFESFRQQGRQGTHGRWPPGQRTALAAVHVERTVQYPQRRAIGDHDLGVAGGRGYAIEFAGPAAHALSIEGRLTLCNLTIEMGSRSGFVAPDDATFAWIAGRPFAPIGTPWRTCTECGPAMSVAGRVSAMRSACALPTATAAPSMSTSMPVCSR